MGRRKRTAEIDESALEVGGKAHAAAGVTAVAVAMKRAVEQMGVARTADAAQAQPGRRLRLPGLRLAGPRPEHRHTAEFCENGAKAVAEEATPRRVGREFFAAPLDRRARGAAPSTGSASRAGSPSRWCCGPGATHYEPITWDDAFALIAGHLRGLASPDEAVFYTSGKTSNEAAFVYQLFVRAFGTNNLPDCSNMCHESTGVALAEAIGIGKGTVSLEDIHRAELIVIVGQNPGTNHPRMLTALEERQAQRRPDHRDQPAARGRAGALQEPAEGRAAWSARARAGRPAPADPDQRRPRAVPGDRLAAASSGTRSTTTSSTRAHHGFEECAAHVRDLDWDAVDARPGSTATQIEPRPPGCSSTPPATVICWAMGITQHRNAVATIQEIVNVALLRGNIGKPGAGLCPVRGHSNVQGDRTMGIWEQVPDRTSSTRCATSSASTRPASTASTPSSAIQAMRDGKARVFIGMGGNFVSAAPDTEVTEAAMRNAALTVHVSTKLNRSHVVTGARGADPAGLGRSEKDRTGGREQRVTVEDSMSAVHASHGPLEPASPHLRSEVDIVCSLALATLGDRARRSRGPAFRDDYTEIRRRIARVVPGCAAFDEKVDQPGGFVLPHPPRDTRDLPDRGGQGGLHGQPDRRARGAGGPAAAADAAQPRPVQHHDLRPRRPLPRASRAAGGSCSCTPTTSPRSASPTATWSTWSASGRDGSERSAPASGSWPTTSRAAARRRTTPRPTRWCRWTPRPSGSNSPTSKSVDRPARRAPGGAQGVSSDLGDAAEGGAEAHRGAGAPELRSHDQPRARPGRDRLRARRPRPAIEVLMPREVPLGGPRAMRVRRTLPQRERSLIGAWCFVDHYGPDDVADSGGMGVAPHPHTGLQTVSWLFTGEIEHRDSAGNQAMVRPGRGQPDDGRTRDQPLRGLARRPRRTLHGAQLWVALPDGGRHTAPGFEHYAPDPVDRRRLGGAGVPRLAARRHVAGVDVHAAAGRGAPARARQRRSTLEVDAAFEHGVLVDSGVVDRRRARGQAERARLRPARAARRCRGRADEPVRLLVLGGAPFGESIVMWWNFVGRTHEEIVAFREEWQAQITADGAVVGGHPGRRPTAGSASSPATTCRPIPAPELPNVRLKERR